MVRAKDGLSACKEYTLGFMRWQGNQWCKLAGRIPLASKAFPSISPRIQAHGAASVDWSLPHLDYLFSNLFSTSRGQKGSRQIETLLYVSHVLCLGSKSQEKK